MESLPQDKRNVSGLTLGISEQTYNRLSEEIQQFRQKIIQIVEQDQNADRTYQLVFHLFPVTNTNIKPVEDL